MCQLFQSSVNVWCNPGFISLPDGTALVAPIHFERVCFHLLSCWHILLDKYIYGSYLFSLAGKLVFSYFTAVNFATE